MISQTGETQQKTDKDGVRMTLGGVAMRLSTMANVKGNACVHTPLSTHIWQIVLQTVSCVNQDAAVSSDKLANTNCLCRRLFRSHALSTLRRNACVQPDSHNYSHTGWLCRHHRATGLTQHMNVQSIRHNLSAFLRGLVSSVLVRYMTTWECVCFSPAHSGRVRDDG